MNYLSPNKKSYRPGFIAGSSPVKVLHVVSGLPDQIGGVAAVVREILASFQHLPDFAHQAVWESASSQQQGILARVQHKLNRSLVPGEQPFQIVSSSPAGHPVVDLKDYDIVHLHKPSYVPWAASNSWNYPDVKFVVHAHSVDGFTGGCKLESECPELVTGCRKCPIVYPVCRSIPRTGLRKRVSWFERIRPTLIANSQHTLSRVRRSPVFASMRSTHVVTPSVQRFCGKTRNDVTAANDVVNVGFSAASVGDINKQFDHFVHVVEQLKEGFGSRLRAVVAGNRPAGDFGDEFIFMGPVPFEHISDFYRSLDLLVVCSRSESFGKVAIEAQNCGTPVLAYAVGGLTEAVMPGVTGEFVEPNNLQQLSTVASQMLRRRHEYRNRLASAEGQLFLESFDANTIKKKYVEIYRDLAKS